MRAYAVVLLIRRRLARLAGYELEQTIMEVVDSHLSRRQKDPNAEDVFLSEQQSLSSPFVARAIDVARAWATGSRSLLACPG